MDIISAHLPPLSIEFLFAHSCHIIMKQSSCEKNFNNWLIVCLSLSKLTTGLLFFIQPSIPTLICKMAFKSFV